MIKIKITRKIAIPYIPGSGCGDSHLEEADIEMSDETRDEYVELITTNAQKASDDEKTAFVSRNLEEELTDSHFAIVDQHFDLYEAVQNAIDENGETPCQQCLYEILSDASCGCPDLIPEAEYKGRQVTLNKPTRGDVKKSKVYVKNEKGNVVKVNFGHGGTSAKKKGEKTMKIKKSIPANKKSFRARHNCKTPGPKTKARYWSCRKW